MHKNRIGGSLAAPPSHTAVLTGPYTAVRWIKRQELFCCRRSLDVSDRRASFDSSDQRQSGLHPLPPFRSRLPGIQSHGRCDTSASTRRFQRSGLQRNSFRLLCRLLTSPSRSRTLRPAQSGLPDTPEISRGKTDRLHRTPAGFTTPTLDDRGPVLVHRTAALLHASFRPHLAMTPLRFANPSPSSGWIEDFHLQAANHARHTTERPPLLAAVQCSSSEHGRQARRNEAPPVLLLLR